jgi:hypothetical protein
MAGKHTTGGGHGQPTGRGIHRPGSTAEARRDDLDRQAERLAQATRMIQQPHNRTSND